MNQLASVGDSRPNPECLSYGDVEARVIIGYGETKDGRQRYQCKSCKKTFNEGKGTMFYNCKTEEKDILECLAFLAEGVRISSISPSKGFKEDTILSFVREAAHHAEAVEAILLNDYEMSQVQIDGLWTYEGHKKNGDERVADEDKGEYWRCTAIEAETRLRAGRDIGQSETQAAIDLWRQVKQGATHADTPPENNLLMVGITHKWPSNTMPKAI